MTIFGPFSVRGNTSSRASFAKVAKLDAQSKKIGVERY